MTTHLIKIITATIATIIVDGIWYVTMKGSILSDFWKNDCNL